MKRNYFDPEMKISTFLCEDVVTASNQGIQGVSGVAAQEGYNDAQLNASANTFEAAYSALDFQ